MFSCKSCKTKIDVWPITSDLVGRSVKGVLSGISGRVFTKGSLLCDHCLMDCKKCESVDENTSKPEKDAWWNPLDFLEE